MEDSMLVAVTDALQQLKQERLDRVVVDSLLAAGIEIVLQVLVEELEHER